MTTTPPILQICGANESQLDVIFIHGLTGSPIETWSANSVDDYWPNWLCESFNKISVFALGYPASIFEQWATKEMDLHERANNLLEALAARGVGNKPIVFITHSLGGIMAKEMLRISNETRDESWRKLSGNTRLVVFLATPHTGAEMANVVQFFVPRMQSSFVQILSNQDGYLSSLNQAYKALSETNHIDTVTYYEKFKTKGVALVVSRESADPGVGKTPPIAIDSDHISICKPSTRDSLLYQSICRHIREALKKNSKSTNSSVEDQSILKFDKGFEFIKIVGVSTIAVSVFGIGNDLVTANLCIEFYKIFGLNFQSSSPVITAIVYGISGTWWMGIIFGAILAFAAQIGPGKTYAAVELLRPISIVMGIAAIIDLGFGFFGYALASDNINDPALLNWLKFIPAEKHRIALAINSAHLGAYIGGTLGALGLAIWVIMKRVTGIRAG